MNIEITIETKVIQVKNLPIVEFDGEIALMNAEKGHYYSLDEIGTKIWSLMVDPITIKEIVDILLTEFDVERDVCEKDVMDLMKQLFDQGLIGLL